MKIRYLTLLTTLVFLGFTVSAFAGKPVCPGDPRCKPDDGGGDETTAEYTAELISGGFVFATATGKLLGLTANRKGRSLPGGFRLEMVPETAFAWDYIFLKDCSALLPSGVAGFGVLAGNWWINYTRSKGGPDKIHITMRDLDIYPKTSQNYNGVDFDFDLHGEIATGEPFLPETVNSSVEHQLTRYMLWAGANGQGGFTCNSAGGGWDGWAELRPSTLKITRVEP
jgi:hypothetical protein